MFRYRILIRSKSETKNIKGNCNTEHHTRCWTHGQTQQAKTCTLQNILLNQFLQMTSKLNSNHELGSFTIDVGNSDLPLALASMQLAKSLPGSLIQAVWYNMKTYYSVLGHEYFVKTLGQNVFGHRQFSSNHNTTIKGSI